MSETNHARLDVKVIPKASREGIAGWLGETLKVRVRAPAQKGKANAAAEALIADALGVGSDRVRVVAGRTSERKVVEVSGLTVAELRRRLTAACGPPAGR
jgi:uncharacterized protein